MLLEVFEEGTCVQQLCVNCGSRCTSSIAPRLTDHVVSMALNDMAVSRIKACSDCLQWLPACASHGAFVRMLPVLSLRMPEPHAAEGPVAHFDLFIIVL